MYGYPDKGDNDEIIIIIIIIIIMHLPLWKTVGKLCPVCYHSVCFAVSHSLGSQQRAHCKLTQILFTAYKVPVKARSSYC